VTSKVHALVDGRGRPLEVLVTAGQANDSPILAALLGLQVPRTGPGPARTRPDAVLGDKAYSSRAHRALLRAAKVTAVIPEPSDQTPRGAGDGPCPVPGLGGPDLPLHAPSPRYRPRPGPCHRVRVGAVLTPTATMAMMNAK